MKRIALLLMTLVMTLAMAGCQNTNDDIYDNSEADGPYPMTFTDKFGNQVVIEEEPQTIISMSPEITEIVYGVEAGDRLIGRSSYCNYPEEVAAVTDYGSLFDLNMESIVAANPDIVFLSSMASEEMVTSLRDLELTVVTLDNDDTLEGTYTYILEVAKMLNQEAEAKSLVEDLRKRISLVEDKVSSMTVPTVYYVVYAGDGYDATATGDTYLNEVITVAGGDNVAKDGSNWSYSVETLVEKDPYILICSDAEGAKEKLSSLEGYKDLTAVKEGRVYAVNEDVFSRQGPRIAEAVEMMAAAIHLEQDVE